MNSLHKLILATAFSVVVHALVCPARIQAENSVAVESKSFQLGQKSCCIGVFVSNDVPLTALVLPLEVRTVSGGAYIASLGFSAPANNRVGSSPLMGSVTSRRYPTPGGLSCSGPVSKTYATSAAALDFVSPDAILWAGVSQNQPPDPWTLSAGSDPSGTGSASFRVVFDVTTTAGTFEVDSCCVTPANHLVFVDENTSLLSVAFTKGVVTVGDLAPEQVDEDGDALPDSWETCGYDADGNGSIDVDLPAMGANARHQDIFVEVDWMGGVCEGC